MNCRTEELFRCIHCLDRFPRDQRTRDHVLPRGWYPDDTPPDLERWTAPCCRGCNTRLSKLEQNLGTRIGLSLGPNHPGAIGIYEKSLRAMNPGEGRDEADSRARLALQREILGDTLNGALIDTRAILAGLGPAEGVPVTELPAIPLPVPMVDGFCHKLTRGALWVFDEQVVEPPRRIELYHVNDCGDQFIENVNELLETSGQHFHRSNTIDIWIAPAVDAPREILMRFRIWSKWDWYAHATELDV